MDFAYEVQMLRGGNPDYNKLIKSVLKKSEGRRNQILLLKNRYRSNKTGVPIFGRYFSDSSKVNNKVNNDFFSEIVDIKTGYFAGNPFSYLYDRTRAEAARAQDRLDRFILLNNLSDLDSESTKEAAIAGYSARLLFTDPEGQERLMLIPAEEVVFISENTITNPDFAARIVDVETEKGKRRRFELYTDTECLVFVEEKKNAFFYSEEDSFEHFFGVCPLFGVPNNEELQGDVEKVLALIDAYDRSLSDVNSEIESFRLAYMLFKGGTVDEETIREAQRTGAFTMPDEGDISFLVKQMNDSIVENHLTRIHENIYRFSKTPDLSDEAFSGNQSGVALKYKLFPLESKCKSFERKFNSAHMHMFRALSNIWNLRNETFDPLSFYVEYKRNFPLDTLHEAQVQQALKGLVSEVTRLTQASFIDDPQYEIEQMEEEALNSVFPAVNLDQPGGQEADGGSPALVGFTAE